MSSAIFPHTETVNYTKGLMLLHVPGMLTLCFMASAVKNQVSAQIVTVFASFAPVLSIMFIQRGNKGAEQVAAFPEATAQRIRHKSALSIIVC